MLSTELDITENTPNSPTFSSDVPLKKYNERHIYLSYTTVQDKLNFKFKIFHNKIVNLMFLFSMPVFVFPWVW